MLKFVYEVEKCENKKLLEKMAAVRTAEEFMDLIGYYSESEAIDAYVAVSNSFSMDFVNEYIAESDCEDIWQCSDIILRFIQDDIEDKYSDEE